MSRLTDTRDPNFAILLICEGQRTEPNFFYCMCNDLSSEGLFTCKYTILPKSSFEKEDEEVHADRGERRRSLREIKQGNPGEEAPINFFPGEQPLNWVKAGLDNLSTYNEVWCIFDKDGHPKQQEAFELVQLNQASGKNINIAFSSRSIEYYFLLHFEYIFKAFDKSECNEKKYIGTKSKTVYFHCMTEKAVEGKACNGELCINGYARKKGYWRDSKTNISLYPILKDKLLIGIKNSIKLRQESDIKAGLTPIYERNPYVTVDQLVARLLGYSVIHAPSSIKADGTNIHIEMDDEYIYIKNIGDITYVVSDETVCIHNPFDNSRATLKMDRRIIAPSITSRISVLDIEDDYLIIMSFGGKNYILDK